MPTVTPNFEKLNAAYRCTECSAYDITTRGGYCDQCVRKSQATEALQALKSELQLQETAA